MIRRVFATVFAATACRYLAAQGTLPAPRQIPGSSKESAPVEEVLQAGAHVVLRIREVISHDGIPPAERILNGQPPLKPFDRFIAEVDGGHPPRSVIGGMIDGISPPSRFGKEGKLRLLLSQVVESHDGRVRPWQLTAGTEGHRDRHRRLLLNSLLLAEGVGVGSSIASQFTFSSANPGIMAIGGGAGLLIATAIAATRRGAAARLDPGDKFEVTVGGAKCKPLPTGTEMTIYPAQERSKP
ncbi:MAG: hypothetical protein FJ261_02990 [Planctomycetes bacterium]|nr:hypothetical protein [Planctomycetota bacterium]